MVLKKIISILKLIIIFLILLNFGGVLSVFFPASLSFAIFLLSIVLFALTRKYIIKKKLILFLFFSYLIISISIFLNDVLFIDYKGIFIFLLSSIIIFSSFENIEEVKKNLIRASKIVMWLAIINFFLTSILSNLYVEAISDDGYRIFTIFYIFNNLGVTYHFVGINFFRNQGVFWEPGILQIIMNILVYYYLFEEKKSLKHILAPVFVLLTTASTTGLIIFTFLFIVKNLKKINIKKVFVFILTGIVFAPILMNDINHKFKGDAKESSQLRTYDALIGIYLISKHPLTGIGISEDKYLKEIRLSSVKINGENLTIERGNTNSIILLCLYFGIPLTIIILYMMYHQNLFKKKWIFFIILITCLASEPVVIRMFSFLLIVSSVKIRSNNYNTKT